MTAKEKFDDSETVRKLLDNLKSGRAVIRILEREKNKNIFLHYKITDDDEMAIILSLTLNDYEESIFYTYGELPLDKLHIFKHNEMLIPVYGTKKRKSRCT